MLIFKIFSIFLLSFSSAVLEDYPEIKQGECYNISQTCASCSYVNISSVTSDGIDYLTNTPLIYFGNGEWRYQFCNTTTLGRYDVKGIGDVNGIAETFAVKFLVGTQATPETENSWVIILAQGFAMGLLLTLSFTFKNKWKVKAFLQLMALLMVILMLNTAQVLITTSEALPSMISISLITSIVLFSIMLVYILIAYTIETINSMKKRRA